MKRFAYYSLITGELLLIVGGLFLIRVEVAVLTHAKDFHEKLGVSLYISVLFTLLALLVFFLETDRRERKNKKN